ncbi:Ribosome-inactivating protein cucurmosin [Euphorbia peplus]|nr:Ribosome-inactivating protein cucurmosin [Euphorbia peplus]
MSIIFVTWLSCIFVIASAINYPTVRFTTHLGSVGSYQTFITSLRNNLQSGSKSHDIAILRKLSEITDQNMFLNVELIQHNETHTFSITVGVSVVNAYVIAYKSGTKSFFFKESTDKAYKLLFDKTTKKQLTVSTNYNNLGDRKKVELGIKPLGEAIETLSKFDGENFDTTFTDSLLVVIQMISEASRFKFIELQIEGDIIYGYKPKWDTITYENKWDKLSEQIQISGTDGKFKTTIELQNADGSNNIVSNVAQVKSDITVMLYHNPVKGIEEEKNGEFSDE